MADNEIKEVEKEVDHQHSESASENRTMNLVDLMSSTQSSDSNRINSIGTLSRTENSLPRITVDDRQDGARSVQEMLSGQGGLRTEQDILSGQGGARTAQDMLSGQGGARTVQDMLNGQGGARTAQEMLNQPRTVQDMLSGQGGARTAQEMLNQPRTLGEAIAQSGQDAATRARDAIFGQDISTPTDLKNDALRAHKEVFAALAQLHPKLQDAFAQLPDAKNGNYSNEQLGFLKQNAGIDAYLSANRYNDSMNALRNQQRNEAMEPGKAKLDHAIDAKLAYREVSAAVSQMPQKLQDAFSKLPDSKSGNYSNEQLAFLKQNAGVDAYLAANRYNDAMNAMRDQSRELGRKEIPKELGSKEIPKELGSKVIPKELGNKEIPKELGSKEIPKELGSKEIPKELGSKVIPKELGNKEIPKELGNKEIPKELGNKVEPKLESKELPQQKEIDKRLDFINRSVAKLPQDLQKEFKYLPLVKNGIGYTDEHVAFLKQHVGKEAAQAMTSYMNERRQWMEGRISGRKN